MRKRDTRKATLSYSSNRRAGRWAPLSSGILRQDHFFNGVVAELSPTPTATVGPNKPMNLSPLRSRPRPQRFPRLAKDASLGAGYRQIR